MRPVLAGILAALMLTGCGAQASLEAVPRSSAIRTIDDEIPPSSANSASEPANSTRSETHPVMEAPTEALTEPAIGTPVSSSSEPAAPAQVLPDSFMPADFSGATLFLYRISDMAGTEVDPAIFFEYSSQLGLEQSEEVGEPLDNPDSMTLTLPDDSRYTYQFYTEGIGVQYAEPGKDAGEERRYRANQAAYTELKNDCWSDTVVQPDVHPRWTLLMRASKAEEIRITSMAGEESRLLPGEESFSCTFEELQRMRVNAGSFQQVAPETRLEDAEIIQIRFYNGIRYDIQRGPREVVIASSDMPYACRYALFRNNPDTAKPVIYLYPEQPTDVSVRLDYQGKFTYTYPAYNDGWQVTAYPDGRLVNKADGSEHYYLFWEGSGQFDWDFSSGFCVPGPETEGFLRKVLPQTGLLPREYNDFITYWVPRMQHNRYNLIHFAGEPYERIAPLTVTPSPDAILRVHMVYRPLASPVELPPQTFEPFERNGFTVVEWGGSSMRAKSD